MPAKLRAKGIPSLVGTWRLVSCEHRLAGGKVWRPFGPRPRGRLIYTPDGYMMVLLMDPARPRSASQGIFESSAAERAAAATGFLAYSGRCELRGGKALHRVDLSLFPNWVGTAQLRSFRVRGKRARFWTRPFESRGVAQTALLVWERVSPKGRG